MLSFGDKGKYEQVGHVRPPAVRALGVVQKKGRRVVNKELSSPSHVRKGDVIAQSLSRLISFLFLRSRLSRYCIALLAAGDKTLVYCRDIISGQKECITYPSLAICASGPSLPKSSGWRVPGSAVQGQVAPWACPGYLSPGT